MNIFFATCAVVCVMLLVFVVYAFLTNMNTSPVSAQKKRLLDNPATINNSVNDTSETVSDNLP